MDIEFKSLSLIKALGSKENAITCCNELILSLSSIKSTVGILGEYRKWVSIKVKLEKL